MNKKNILEKTAFYAAPVLLAVALILTACSNTAGTTAVGNGGGNTPGGTEPAVSLLGTKARPDAIGDIVLTDGSAVPYADITPEQKSHACAIVFYAGAESDFLGKRVLAAGLETGVDKAWATAVTGESELVVKPLECTPSKDGKGAAADASFTGLTDGNTAWEKMVKFNPRAPERLETAFTAWAYALNYGKNNFPHTPCENGWYLPSIAELTALYRKKDLVNEILTGAWESKDSLGKRLLELKSRAGKKVSGVGTVF
ncbi:hypothetical protein [Treponema pedis]|uniref:hypothetical protein n=1 Tax=Treponema pedis TaxID=409322 RepID=UPI000405BD25|nr:hypothetical protein [Treponema pedis]